MKNSETDPIPDIDEILTGIIHKSCCIYTRAEAVFGCTTAHKVGKGYLEPSTTCMRPALVPAAPRPSAHVPSSVDSRVTITIDDDEDQDPPAPVHSALVPSAVDSPVTTITDDDEDDDGFHLL